MSARLISPVPESQQKFEATFNQVAVGMAHVTLEGKFQLLNRKFCEIAGHPMDELVGRSFAEITHPDDLASDVASVQRMLKGEINTYTMEKRYIRKNGSIAWIALTASLVKTAQGEPHFFIAVIEDIGSRKSTEAALARLQIELEAQVSARTDSLEEATKRLRHEIIERKEIETERNRFFTISEDAMIVFENDGRFRRFNPAFSNILGYSETELMPLFALDLVHPDDKERTMLFGKSIREMKVASNFENRYIRKDGTVVHLSWNVNHFAPQALTYAIARDVTELKRLAKDREDERNRGFAESKMNALGRMAAGLAHEINNPLTIVYGKACLLRKYISEDKVESTRIRDAAAQIEEMSVRIMEIIKGLRSFLREGAADPMVNTRLATILENTLSFCHSKIATRGILLEASPIPKHFQIECRPVQISQVIVNLLNNAIDALELSNTKIVRIESLETETHLGLAIEDSGEGVSDESKPHLFEPFFTTKAVGKGTGLGLSVSKGIVEAHGGTIFFEKSSSSGARVTFLLPKSALPSDP